ncbi:MAG: hypothetical protein U0326_37350 [Polyangiales bacterium]
MSASEDSSACSDGGGAWTSSGDGVSAEATSGAAPCGVGVSGEAVSGAGEEVAEGASTCGAGGGVDSVGDGFFVRRSDLRGAPGANDGPREAGVVMVGVRGGAAGAFGGWVRGTGALAAAGPGAGAGVGGRSEGRSPVGGRRMDRSCSSVRAESLRVGASWRR